jgi:hypothetical protein
MGAGGAEMGQQETLTVVYDSRWPIGVGMEFSESDFEVSSIPDFALAGPLRHSTGRPRPRRPRAPVQTLKCSRRFAVELVAIPGGFRDLRSYLGIGTGPFALLSRLYPCT